MFYYYSITNDINNKSYIGITTTPIRRKNCHFNYLRQNKHFNPKLQNAFNKYGEEYFHFDIIEAIDYANEKEAYEHEAFLIKQYDSVDLGYNCNPGGEWTGRQGMFKHIDIMYIKSCDYYNEQVAGILKDIYNCSRDSIYGVINNKTYVKWCEEFDNLEENEKRNYYEDFCDLTNFHILHLGKNKSGRQLTKEQIFAILLNDEFKYTTFAILRRRFGFVDDHRYVFSDIRKGKTYKEYYYEYNHLSIEEKQKMLCRYTEMYKR